MATNTYPKELTHSIPQRSEDIIGRKEELSETHRLLTAGHPTVLFNGIGGIGKTTIAREYMIAHRDEYAYLAWVTVQSSVAKAFAENFVLIENLGLTHEFQTMARGHDEAAFEEKVMQLLINKMGQLGKVLVVVDNANTLSDLVLFTHLFNDAPCHFLFTSREKPVGWQMVEVPSLSDEECLAVFRKYHPSVKTTDDKLLAVVQLLLNHTLLIELVARAVRENDIAFDDLHAALSKHPFNAEIVNEIKVGTGKHGALVPNHVKMAYISDYVYLIFDTISQISDDAQILLKAFALLPPATDFSKSELLDHFTLFPPKAEVWQTFNVHLIRRGWVEKIDKPDGVKYRLHPLIAHVVVHKLKVDLAFAGDYLERITKLIDYRNTDVSHNLFEKQSYQHLAVRLADLFFEENTEGVAKLLNSLGILFEQFGFYQKTVEYKVRALAIAELIFDKRHDIIATYQNNLGWTYQLLGLNTEAAALLEQALASNLKIFGKEHSFVAINQSNLANVYINLNRFLEAASLLEQALENGFKNFGQEHPSIIIRQSSLANLYRNLGRNEEAVTLLEQALSSGLKNFEQNHPAIATYQSNLAVVYRNLGRNEEAATLLEQALTSGLKNFGHEHPSVAMYQSNLAFAYQNLGRIAEAKALWQSAYRIWLKAFGENYPNTQAAKKMLTN